MELWRECAHWLCRVGVLAKEHHLSTSSATILDLAYTLRDGVLLCQLAVQLDPDSLDFRIVNQRPGMAQFLCLKNIRLFLVACMDSFGLRENDLFQPAMLYDYTDFARVLHTLSKLSKSPKASNFLGFPSVEHNNNGIKHVDGLSREEHEEMLNREEEQIYRALEATVDDNAYEAFYYRLNNEHNDRTNEAYYASSEFNQQLHEEEIYEDLCSFKTNASNVRQSLLQQASIHLQPKEKRDHCIKELIETEANYVDVLNMLRKHFIRPITCMREADKKIVFLNIKELGETHTAFYQELVESISGKSRKFLGSIFLEFQERFLRYGDYCAHLPIAHRTLDTLLARDESVRDEIAACETAFADCKNNYRFKLRDLLAVPMQRVLKYHLILKELIAHTSHNHEEIASLTTAYEAMLDVSASVNETKRDAEQLAILAEIESSISECNLPANQSLKDYGRLRKDGELRVQSHDALNNKTKTRYVFVFDKVILLCKARNNDHYVFKDAVKVADYKVEDRPDIDTSITRWTSAFLLVHTEELNVFTLYTKTREEKTAWMTALKEAQTHVSPSSSHQLKMHTYDRPTYSCSVCNKLLKGLFYQGYRCSKCGRDVHKACIDDLEAIKCGGLVQSPPHLPPRPPSMHLPNRVLPLPPSLAVDCSNSDYINTKMDDHSWFVGELDRDSANARLAPFPPSTFLVRCRVQNGQNVGHALSLKTNVDVKHMKICESLDADDASSVLFFLSDTRKFRSIVELVAYYGRHSLRESFNGLDAVLRFSVGEVCLVEALFDFTPDESDTVLLPLTEGECVTVIDKSGDATGWWKAYNGVTVGFIPKEYVRIVSHK